MQYDMQPIPYSMEQNWLNFNVAETKFMMIRSRRHVSRTEIRLKLNGDITENFKPFRYLGMIIDSHVVFHDHTDSLTNELGLLDKIHWLFDENTSLMLFKSLITTQFDFGSILYEIAAVYQLNRLQVVQNEATQLILLAAPSCPIYALHEKQNLDTFATRCSKTMVKLIIVCHKQPTPCSLHGHLISLLACSRDVKLYPINLTNLWLHSIRPA